MYQGPNIPHWRDYLLGEYSYHLFVHFFNATSKMNQIDDFIIGRNHDVETAQEKFALELDGRPNRWTKEQTSEEFSIFDNNYYKTEYQEFVNNFDDWKLVEKKKEMTVFNKNKIDFTKNKLFFGEELNTQRFDEFKYPIFDKLTQTQLGYFWRPEEVSLQKDRNDYATLNDAQKHIFTSNLRYQTLLDSVQGRARPYIFTIRHLT